MAKKTDPRRTSMVDTAKLDDHEGFLKDFENESDRAAAVLGEAFVDEALKELLVQFLVDDSEFLDDFIGIHGPIGPFVVRAKLAYALGLIRKSTYRVLKVIADVRNEFGHRLHGISFDDPEFKKARDTINQLLRQRLDFKPRMIYLEAVLTCLKEIRDKAKEIRAQKLRCTAVPDRRYSIQLTDTAGTQAKALCRGNSPPSSYIQGESESNWARRIAKELAPEIEDGKDVVGIRKDTRDNLEFRFQMQAERYMLMSIQLSSKAPKKPPHGREA